MFKRSATKSLESALLKLQKHAKKSAISFREIVDVLSGRGKFFFVLLLALPFCQPIQLPGLSVPFGLAICFFGLRISFGKHIWLPKAILDKRISSSSMQKITSVSLKVIRKIRPLIHPRIDWACHHPAMHVAIGVLIALMGLCLALPLPIPLTNLAAAWSLLFLSIGVIEDDGIFVFIGIAAAIATVAFFIILGISVESVITHTNKL